MGEYLRFNRHKVFNADDRSLVLDLIKKVEPFGKESNMLYGLFDGYLYVDLPSAILEAIDYDMLYLKLRSLIDKIHDHSSTKQLSVI